MLPLLRDLYITECGRVGDWQARSWVFRVTTPPVSVHNRSTKKRAERYRLCVLLS